MIGNLNRLMTLQERASTPDGGGGFSESWEDVAGVYVGVVSTAEAESPRPGGTAALVSAVLVMRYRDDVTPGMRLADGGRVYHIQSFSREKGGDYLRVVARLEA